MAAVDDAASVLLLRALRSGAVDVDCSFVHRIDVCSAAPEDLVANLQPVPGTDLAEDGYNSVWYFYCPKRFKNAQGKPSGHRQRAIAGGETCWHSEAGPKPVKGVDGATHCNLSFGRKEGSSRSFNRMGWCMTEYDDKNGDGGGDHVLCKVHRSSSSLAKGKSKLATKNSSGCKKRKATDDHAQAPPMKMSLPAPVDDQVYHQVLPPLLTCHQMMTMPDCVDYESLFLDEEEQLQHTTLFQVEKEQPQQITMIPAEEQQLQQNTFFLPEEQQLQQDTFFPAEQQQLEQNTFFPGEEQQPIEQNTLFTMEELLRGLGHGEHEAFSPNHKYTMDDLFNSCSVRCDTPKAMPPPDALFFQGLDAF